jgi:hypothetical protein
MYTIVYIGTMSDGVAAHENHGLTTHELSYAFIK